MKDAIAFLLITITTTSAYSKVLPDAVDLKAAYCIQIVRSSTDLGNGDGLAEPQKSEIKAIQEKARQNLRRLQLYLLPRMEILDVDPLFGAFQGAQDDQARSLSEVQSCMGKPQPELKACLEVETEAQKRIRSCRDLSFLPF